MKLNRLNLWLVGLSMLASSARIACADIEETSPGASLWDSASASVKKPVEGQAAISMPVFFDSVMAGPGSQASTQPLLQDKTQNSPSNVERSIAEFLGHFSAYEPMYFIAGPYDPLAKFEFSFKFKLFSADSPVAEKIPLLAGLHFSYSQISLWRLNKTSQPFYDTSYKPEFFFSNEDIRQVKIPGVSELGLQTGVGHESNGRDGTASRGINILFFRPIFNFGDPEQFHFYIAPKLFVYLSDSDNRDISKYRGYCDLRATVGWRQGLELSALGRLGSDYNRGSIQMDLSYPIRDLLDRNLDIYIDAQYFYGYGETLLGYNQRSQAFRMGFGLAR